MLPLSYPLHGGEHKPPPDAHTGGAGESNRSDVAPRRRPMKRHRVAFALVALLALAACGGEPTGSTPTPSQEPAEESPSEARITAKDNSFDPSSIEVAA